MIAARTRLEIATENLANVSTAGFRRSVARALMSPAGVTVERQRTSGGVDAIAEMIDVLAADRSFESAAKAVTAIDASRQKAAEAARVS